MKGNIMTEQKNFTRYIGCGAPMAMPTFADLKLEMDAILGEIAELEKMTPAASWTKTIAALNRRNQP